MRLGNKIINGGNPRFPPHCTSLSPPSYVGSTIGLREKNLFPLRIPFHFIDSQTFSFRINKILTIILGLLLLNLIREYLWVRPPSHEHLSVTATPIEINVQRKEWDYYSSVFNGKNEPIKISLPLTLHGTIISNPQRSFAVIEDHGIQGLYGLGDMVNGARIVAMSRNRVVLDYNGAKQELNMVEDRPRPYVQSKALNKKVDFAKLMAQVRIKPYFEDGRCVGFQIGNIDGSIKQMGLQDGDIVESINGVKISDPLKALEILYRSNPVHLGIERQDEKIELDCVLEG